MVTCVVRYRGENMVTISWDSLPVECKTTGGTRPRHEELQESREADARNRESPATLREELYEARGSRYCTGHLSHEFSPLVDGMSKSEARLVCSWQVS